MKNRAETIRVVIDRREGSVFVAFDDHDTVYEVPSKSLPSKCRRESAVLDVPLDEAGQPVWNRAVRNAEEEAKRLREAHDRLDRLRRTDPGGDVQL